MGEKKSEKKAFATSLQKQHMEWGCFTTRNKANGRRFVGVDTPEREESSKIITVISPTRKREAVGEVLDEEVLQETCFGENHETEKCASHGGGWANGDLCRKKFVQMKKSKNNYSSGVLK